MSDKTILREQARARRREIAAVKPDAAFALAAHAGSMPTFRTIAVYKAMGAEIDPEPLARALLAQGCSLCLPVVEVLGAPLLFRLWVPGDPLVADAAGCPAPLPQAGMADPDLVLTPLLAFDRKGTRLGQGGGYYDRTFEARPHVTRIGLAFAEQEVDCLPAEGHDVGLQGVLTETGYQAFDTSI